MSPWFRAGPRALAPVLLAAALAACSDSGLGKPARRPELQPGLAWQLVRAQMSFGPRYAGHQGHDERGLPWMREQLDLRADTLVTQEFTHTAADGKALRLTNFLGRFSPDSAERILLVAHWDTRRYADGSGAEIDRRRPVPGANDGAAGVAVLLAVAELLAQQRPGVGVDVLLTDGDDYGPGAADMLLGTRHYLANLPAGAKPRVAFIVDMVGEAGARLPREAASVRSAPAWVDRVWGIAGQMKLDSVFVADSAAAPEPSPVALFAAAGIPAVLLTDPEYGPGNRYWHSVDDLAKNLDTDRLDAVADVLAEVVYRGVPKAEGQR